MARPKDPGLVATGHARHRLRGALDPEQALAPPPPEAARVRLMDHLEGLGTFTALKAGSSHLQSWVRGLVTQSAEAKGHTYKDTWGSTSLDRGRCGSHFG